MPALGHHVVVGRRLDQRLVQLARGRDHARGIALHRPRRVRVVLRVVGRRRGVGVAAAAARAVAVHVAGLLRVAVVLVVGVAAAALAASAAARRGRAAALGGGGADAERAEQRGGHEGGERPEGDAERGGHFGHATLEVGVGVGRLVDAVGLFAWKMEMLGVLITKNEVAGLCL